MMNKLSVVIITYNEAERIHPCLESVKWADEIIVVDSLSTDETVKICLEYTPHIFSQPWLGYGAQKNLALSKAHHDWVLSLDADERVTPKLREEIYDVLSGNTGYSGYYIPRKSYFLGRWIRYCGWYPDYNLRLFRRGEGIFKERMVHECVELKRGSSSAGPSAGCGEHLPAGRQVGAKRTGPHIEKAAVGYLKGDLEHETYRSLEEYLERMQRYSTLAAQEMEREGRSVNGFDLLLRPPATFLKMYIMQQGFREGWRGFLLSVFYSMYTFSKYAKRWEAEEHQRGSR